MLLSNAACFCLLLLAWSGSSAEAVVSRSSSFDRLLEGSMLVGVGKRRESSNAVETSDVERQALVDLYHSTNGEGWTTESQKNWLDGDPCVNQWYGVSCDEYGGVTRIELWDNGMTGVLVESIGDLLSLKVLDLWIGQIGGSIPASIGNLRNVTFLALLEHEFEGEIPASVGNMTKLESFYGYRNRLEGKVPEFTKSEALTLVSLLENTLSGELPSFSTNINLQILNLNDNNLSGTIPSFSTYTNLQQLILDNNQLSGSIPSFSTNINLQYLQLSDNNLSGSIPSFSNNTNLQTLYLSDNNLSGSIPSFSTNIKLQYLDLSDNNLSGSIPSFSNNTNLQGLYLENNKLSGPLPSFTSNPLLQELYIQNNQLSGPLPHDFSATPLLQTFFAYNNDFSGTLSPTLFDLKNITDVILSGNANLKGTLPSILSTPSLTSLVIEGCAFTGPLPKTIMSPLASIYLAGNSFTSSIPALPPTIRDVSLAYNQITGSIPDSFFSDTPSLTFFDVRHNKIGGHIPSSLSALSNLADLKLDLNDFSGEIPSSVSNWPIFTANNSNTTVLFGNVWSCPVPDTVREHSNEDPGHAYSCGGSEFVTPAILAAAAGALFVIAASFTKQCESVLGLIGTYTRGRHEVLSDASNIVNIGHACYKLVLAVLLASVGLSVTYWNADSNFETQPTFLKLSVSLKTASNWLVLPLLAITTLLLLYFINWGWNLRFEGHVNVNGHAEETTTVKKKPLSGRGTLKLFGIFAYTIIFVVAFDFIYVFFVATSPTISPSNKAFANTALSQFKSTLLNERWVAKESMKLLNPKKRFNFLVFTMSVVMLLNALVVPSILILLLDERCFKYKFVQQKPHEADVPITHCQYIDDNGDYICPTPIYPNDGYVTDIYTTTFNYPWSLSDQCGSAVIQVYSPVVILELLFSGFLQPALWWFCIDGGKAQVVKWMVLTIGMSVSLALPQVVNLFADDIDSGDILPGDWALVLLSAGVFVFVFLVGWGASKLRKDENDNDEEEETTAGPEAPTSFYLPPVDFLLDTLDYNIDEDRVFGQQENFRWPLVSSVLEGILNTASNLLDCLGFAKGNFDGDLKTAMDDFTLEEEDEEGETNEEEEDAELGTDAEIAATEPKQKLGRYLPYTYANLVKNVALIFTFGVASPLTAWIGCLGMLCRWLALSFLAERFNEKKKRRGEEQIKTDAQGIPFRCIVLVVICNIGFFSTAALLSGISVDGKNGGTTFAFLAVMAIILISYMMYLAKSEYMRVRRERETGTKGTLTEPLLSLAGDDAN